MDFFRPSRAGVELFMRLTPRSSADRVETVEQLSDGRCHIKARVRAVPEDGKANIALEKLVAKTLGLARSQVQVISGTTSREKTLELKGDTEELSALLRTRFPDA